MKALAPLLVLATSMIPTYAAAVSSNDLAIGTTNPLNSLDTLAIRDSSKSSTDCEGKDNWGNAVEGNRKKITIRDSKDDKDDVSDDFLAAVKKANKGGMLHLKKGQTYILGKKLDLTFLDDIYIKIDGELKVCIQHILMY
jgi:galacturan 1,4-alpha-galacturonidase